MTRFVVDSGVVLKLAAERNFELPAAHELLAPTLLRSQALSAMHEAVRRGDLADDVALERLARVNKLPIRLLGDAVLRRLDSQENLLRIARELSTLNESLQALAYAALGQQPPQVRRRRTG